MLPTIRQVKEQDVEFLKVVIDSNALFPSELLEGMMENYFNEPSSTDIWLTKEENNIPVAVAYCAPERFTEGTYNLYLIAVHKNYQGRSIGAEIIAYLEETLRTNGQRILLVETSGFPEFELTRKFYEKCKYNREAVIRDFYREGEDKIVFWKKLNAV
ncbi:MAG: hypothetical protein AVDCRST_MAG95-3043 [uncultured Adhaeribacter sp.]|uniref:N-acetyltransferase domain-containing protein n=1 Tax=uncultured Adhaeribacter sp. TaxID=448109 RepID=A0A6J4JEU6_9BACT|nr:MAG: hypothetical protein AVDCRST_MAG95-3043 [uncultured Adhaeribacter sp.]